MIPDVLSSLRNINIDPYINYLNTHSELDGLFTYSTTHTEICPNLLKKIIKGYAADNWWAK